MRKFADIDTVRQTIKDAMPLNEFIQLADTKYAIQASIQYTYIEMVHENLYKKRCDLNEHPMDDDGTRDSTASFTITPNKELWYCFGCGAGGDRFEYISKKFNVDHVEAITISAEIVGLDLSPFYAEITDAELIIDGLFKENSQARDIAHAALLSNAFALDYVRGRGITDESIEAYQIGYAPAIDGGITLFEQIGNSITLQLDRRDQFNHAILFPITDVFGRMRYFQSRPFNPITGMKYIGGSEKHPLYDDTDRIFGLHIAKKNLYKNNGVLIGVEGAPDAIACAQIGLPTCGFLGTAVNQLTFDLLGKYRVAELVLLLDGDKAGRDRSYKICEKYLALNTAIRLRVASLPEGYDPDEFINKFGGDELKKIVKAAPYAIQYLIDSKWNDAHSPTEKMSFMSDIQPYMVAITDKVVYSIMVKHIASLIGLDPIQIEDHYMQSIAKSAGAKLYAPDGEEILLGEAIRDPDFITELTMRFTENDWYLVRHKNLFKILKTTEYTDTESLHTIATNIGVGDIVTVEWLDRIRAKHGNVQFSLYDVEDKLIRRKALDIIDSTKIAVNDMTQDITMVLDRMTSNVYGVVYRKLDEKIFNAKQQVSRVMKLVHERMQNPGNIIGYEFGGGFEKLSLATLGLQTQTLNVVAANQTVGKTQICENWGLSQAIVQQIPTLWFSLEMDTDRMTFRNLSILSGVPSTDIMTGNITAEEKEKLDLAAVTLENAQFFLSERGHDLTEAMAIARRYVMRYGVRIVYVDYAQLQYISDRKTEARHRELGQISKGWKQFAQEMDVAVVLVSQLSKAALDAEIAKAEHGAGSYEIAQDADTYITLKEKDKDEIERSGIQNGNLIMNIDKNRMGEREVLINLYADRPVHKIYEV